MPTASNPYPIEGPLRRQDVLVDREGAFAWIASSLAADERLLAILGFPRIGKTSLLNHLPDHLGPDYLYVRNWIPSPEKWELGPWLQQLQADLQAALADAGRQWERPASHGKEASAVPFPWPGLEDALDQRSLLLMIDGASLYVRDPARWEALATFCAEFIRAHDARIVMAIQGTSEQVAATGSALARIPAMSLRLFGEGEAEELLVKTARGRLIYDYDAVKALHSWTGGHPFLLQLFGYVLFELHSESGRVDVHAANKVVDQICAAADNLFSFVWSTLSPAAKVVMAVLGQAHGRHDLFTRRDIHDFLRWSRVRIPSQHVDSALKELGDAGILVPMGADSYRVPIRLVLQWIESRKPVAKTLAEAKPYRQGPSPKKGEPPKEPIRWTAFISWGLSLMLIAFIVYLWNARGDPDELIPVPSLPTVASAAPPATATAQPKRFLAFGRRESNDAPSSIFSMREDGSDAHKMTDDQAADESPAWSPDGEQILFASDIAGNWDIWSMDVDRERLTKITDSPEDDWMPAWSRDGNAIAFASRRDGNWEIYVARADGSRPVRITNHEAADLCPSWAPDRSRLAFASQRDGNWEIYVVNSDGSGLQRLTENEITDYAPAWSPQGDEIAFESYRDGNMEIYVLSLSDGQLLNLTNDPAANDHGPAWSPDGARIAYYSNRDGGWDILVINRDGSGKANVTRSPALEQNPSWGP